MTDYCRVKGILCKINLAIFDVSYILSQTYNATSVCFYCFTQEQYQINFASTELDCRTIDTSHKILFVTFWVMRLEKLTGMVLAKNEMLCDFPECDM